MAKNLILRNALSPVKLAVNPVREMAVIAVPSTVPPSVAVSIGRTMRHFTANAVGKVAVLATPPPTACEIDIKNLMNYAAWKSVQAI